jgi:glycosyltransferase involved in cell wall biosynthesis
MRLLLAARRFPPDIHSGTETVFEALYARAREKHDVHLVVGYSRERHLVPPEAVAVDLRGKDKPRQWLAVSRAIYGEARKFRPDLVLSNSIEVPPTGFVTACIVHDLNFGRKPTDSLAMRARARVYAERAKRMDAIITVSAASALALARIGVPEGRIHVIHNGVDLETFRPDPDPASPEDGIVRFAYPSRILPGKGQHQAIDAVARLPREHKARAHLTIAGAVADPVYLDQIRIQAFHQPVDFALDVPSLAPHYQAADIVLFPTLLVEGFGFTAVEAMACGKPVVWFDQPAIREATGGIGMPVPKGDVVALRTAMMTLMDDPELRRRLGSEGRRYCEGNRGWDEVWTRYEGVLGNIAR